MKTIAIKLPEDLDVRLAKRAKRLGVSKSEVAREGRGKGKAKRVSPIIHDFL